MATLTAEQIGVLVYANKAWGPGGSTATIVKFLDTAIAVALAESHGNTEAISPTHDYGLWQINKAAHADLFANHNWKDARDNTEMARIVWTDAGRSFSPWTTYKSGAYKAYTGHGAKVYDTLQKSVKSGDHSTLEALIRGIPVVGGWAGIFGLDDNAADAVAGGANKAKKVVTGPADIVAGALKDSFKWLASAALVIGATLLALILFGVGVWLIVSNTKTGKQIGQAAKSTAEKAAVAAAL
jgi:hypothetical protein